MTVAGGRFRMTDVPRKPRKCPLCRKPSEWEDNPYRPFCSERCQLIDLGSWAAGWYRVPGPRLTIDPEEPGPSHSE